MNLMCWRNGSLMVKTDRGWISYAQHPQKQPDDHLTLNHGIPSKGWRTMQHLLKMGYKLVNEKEMT